MNGRRVYLCDGLSTLEVHAIAAPITEIRVWPDGLEGQLFHPLLLQRIADADWSFIRFMDWGATNASPVRDWSDRRLPAHAFMTGVINPRAPAAGSEGNRETGAAYEQMVALCNATGRNLWINVPHLATDDFTTKLAKLIRFGSDGVNPYDAPQASPVFAPLRSDLLVYVEYSNEIWSGGFAFPQGDWAEQQAATLGITRAQFNARRFSDMWRLFQQAFGGPSRLVRVAATFTSVDSYTNAFLGEMQTYGSRLDPAVQPDVLAVTTYFGNGIQRFVDEKGFTDGKLFNDPYWTSAAFDRDRRIAFEEWKRRILAGDATSGSGPDATGIGGGFSASLRSHGLPIIAYEGGPSLYTNDIDGNATNASGIPTDDGVTMFIEAMNRDPRIVDVYRIHLELAKSKGLWTHTPYTDAGVWSKFGQWGHLETLDQAPASAPKYALLLEHAAQFANIRSIDAPLGRVPRFTTDAVLSPGIAGQPYVAEIQTTDGDGARAIIAAGAYLDSGLTISNPSPGVLRISGVPTTSRRNYFLARVTDADGDPAWRIFTLETFGGPGTLVQSDFRGASPSTSLPWTSTFVRVSQIGWSGWTFGPGAVPESTPNALAFSVTGTSSGNEPLEQAIADGEYLRATITQSAPLDLRNAEVRFTTRRIDFHSPLGYALVINGARIYVSAQVDKDNFDEIEHVVMLPANFATVSAPLELRIYAFGAQFDGHVTSLTAFKLTSAVRATPRRRSVAH